MFRVLRGIVSKSFFRNFQMGMTAKILDFHSVMNLALNQILLRDSLREIFSVNTSSLCRNILQSFYTV
jgi:hypothetical protein